jgi:NAD(P)-dependent dehydrogenase (short-subunit alcohol dehydrogenase family)
MCKPLVPRGRAACAVNDLAVTVEGRTEITTPSPQTLNGPAIVTGAGRGIGRAIAVALAEAGFSIAALARSGDELRQTTAELRRRGVPALGIACDVRDSRATAAAIDEAEAELGPIAALVNNAGTGRALGPLWEVDEEEWWGDVETTLRGAFNACRAVIPGFLERRAGRIVNVSSYVAVRPSPYQSGYAAGKAALLSLSEALAASLASHGIAVFAFTPGYVQTALTRHIAESEEGRKWLPEVGTGRVLQAEEGANIVAALVSGRADALSGRFIHALDDLDQMLRRSEEIEREDYYAPRLRRLPPDP